MINYMHMQSPTLTLNGLVIKSILSVCLPNIDMRLNIAECSRVVRPNGVRHELHIDICIVCMCELVFVSFNLIVVSNHRNAFSRHEILAFAVVVAAVIIAIITIIFHTEIIR